MNNGFSQLLDRLKMLNLYGMAEAAEDLLNMPIQLRPGLETALSKLIDTEVRHRDDKRTARLLKSSKLKIRALIEDVICSSARNFTHEQLSSLADCSFVRRGENLVITGKTGCGKTFLACALGRQACMLGMKTLYLNMNHFVEVLAQARLDGTVNQLLARLDKNDLIILDDFGLQKMDSETRLALLRLIDERYNVKAMVIVSQLPFDKWYDYLADPTIADAFLDRLVNSSNLVALDGPSLRNKTRITSLNDEGNLI